MMLHAVAVRLTPSDRASGMPKRACRAPRVYFRRFGAISPVEPAACVIAVLASGCRCSHLVDEAVFERMSGSDAHDLVHDLHGPQRAQGVAELDALGIGGHVEPQRGESSPASA